MAAPRLGLIRGLKLWFDILFFVGGASILALTAWLALAPLARGDQGRFDVALPVALGERSVRPVLDLSSGPGTEEGMSELRIVDGRGELRLHTDDVTLHLVGTGVILTGIAVVLWGLFLLRRILTNAARGQPFHPSSARALNQVGWILVVAGILVPLVQNLMARIVLPRIEVTNVTLAPPLDFSSDAIVGGLLLLVLASVWAQATEMAEEQSLTI